jgi:uncharacterized membrane protein HdeD (DUF308 family)
MAMSLEAAASAMRDAMRDREALFALVPLARNLDGRRGVLALIFPMLASVDDGVARWILIISGVVQGIGLIGARHVPHFWLQLVSVALSILVGWLLLSRPEGGLLLFTVLLLVYFMVEGISKVIFGLTIRPLPNWGWVFGSGVVGLLLALYLFANISSVSEWALGLLLGIQLLCEGVALTYLAWRIRES